MLTKKVTESFGSEETFIENLQKLKGRFVDVWPRAAGVEQRHVDDRRVVVARILSVKVIHIWFWQEIIEINDPLCKSYRH